MSDVEIKIRIPEALVERAKANGVPLTDISILRMIDSELVRAQASKERFNRWFVAAIGTLKEMPNGDGGFAAMMIAVALYERAVAARLRIANRKADDAAVREAINEDLGLSDDQRRIFWDMFRNGLMHQATPRAGKTEYWFRSDFPAKPKFQDVNGALYVIIDPWKFAEYVLQMYKNDPYLISATENASLPMSIPPSLR